MILCTPKAAIAQEHKVSLPVITGAQISECNLLDTATADASPSKSISAPLGVGQRSRNEKPQQQLYNKLGH